MTGRARRVRYPVPGVSACENVGAYSREQIESIAAHLRSARPWKELDDAATGWQRAGQSLERVSRMLRDAGEVLAAACRSEDAAACQDALRRLHATARHLEERTYQLVDYTRRSAAAVEQGVKRFPVDEPGLAQRMLGETVGGAVENLFNLGPSDEDYRQALQALTNEYLTINTGLPPAVSGEFPDIVLDTDTWRPEAPAPTGVAAAPSAGGPVSADAGAPPPATAPVPSGPAAATATSAPAAGAVSAAAPVPAIGRLDDGSTGGLSGAAPAAAPAGVPASPTVGAGPAAPSAGPIGAGPAAAAPVTAGLISAGRSPAVQPGGQVPPAGTRPGPAVAATGAGPTTAGAGRPGATPGLIGAQPAAQPAGRGGTTVGGTVQAAGGRGAVVPPAGTTGAAGAVGSRGVAGAGAGAGRRADRQDPERDTWLTEDEDLWADPGAAPSVLR